MAVVICRGAIDSGGVTGTLGGSLVALAVFAVLGAILGQLAQNAVDESVRSKLQQQLTLHVAGNDLQESVA
jgi:hypothetical protein